MTAADGVMAVCRLIECNELHWQIVVVGIYGSTAHYVSLAGAAQCAARCAAMVGLMCCNYQWLYWRACTVAFK